MLQKSMLHLISLSNHNDLACLSNLKSICMAKMNKASESGSSCLNHCWHLIYLLGIPFTSRAIEEEKSR